MDRKRESEIISSVLNGSVMEFRHLVEFHKHHVYALSLRILKNKQEAEEISQDAFVKAFKSLSGFNGKSSFSTWLYRIVYNTAISFLRKKKLQTVSLDDVVETSNWKEGMNALQQMIHAEKRELLWGLVDTLPEKDATIVELYYVHEKDMNEIGEILEMTHGNVRIRLMRIRKRLLQLITEKQDYKILQS